MVHRNSLGAVSHLTAFLLIGSSATVALPAVADVPAEVAARLGQDLTPMGAEQAGNAEGTIPPWEGGLSEPPPGWTPGSHHIDPFEDDERLFTISRDTMEAHANRLTGAHRALLERYGETYEMHVYPSRRTCTVPDWVKESVAGNALRGEMTTDGNGVTGAIHGPSFPVPSNGLEVIWNHMLGYITHKATRQFAAALPMADGDYNMYTVQDQAILRWGDPEMTKAEDLDNVSIKYIAHTIAPARVAGTVILVHETVNRMEQERQAWRYDPGSRRVRRAPDIAYDNPGTNSDGLATADQFGGFNGSPDRYDWKLVKKQEAYIPYNNYRLSSPELDYDDIVRPRHINQDLVRYELHRVWVLEATLRPDARHLYSRRTFYIDEDSWQIVAAELYDGRGELWRIQEGFPKVAYQVPSCVAAGGASYDLSNQRYLIGGLTNEEPPVDYFAEELDEDDYSPSAIRRLGVR